MSLFQPLPEPQQGKFLTWGQTLLLWVLPTTSTTISTAARSICSSSICGWCGKKQLGGEKAARRSLACVPEPARLTPQQSGIKREREREERETFSKAMLVFIHMKCPLVALKECLSAGRDKPPGEQISRPAEQKQPCVGVGPLKMCLLTDKPIKGR